MAWSVILFTVTWILSWAAFLQSTYYAYIKTFVPDETAQGRAAYYQSIWAVGGVLLLIFAGVLLCVTLV